jgi:hypothetical protein
MKWWGYLLVIVVGIIVSGIIAEKEKLLDKIDINKPFLALGEIIVILTWCSAFGVYYCYISSNTDVSGIVAFFKSAIFLILYIFAILILFSIPEYIYECKVEKNEKTLKKYLLENCCKLGYMDVKMWNKKLPQFYTKLYKTSFDEITKQFSLDVEKTYIEDDKEYLWLNPIIDAIFEEDIVSEKKLYEILYNSLKFTHCTSNEDLTQYGMDNVIKLKLINGHKMIENITLEGMCHFKFTTYAENNLPGYHWKLEREEFDADSFLD